MLFRSFLLLSLQISLLYPAFGQSADADFLRSTGKIYVVVAVILALFLGIVLFLVRLDRKLSRLEHQIDQDD